MSEAGAAPVPGRPPGGGTAETQRPLERQQWRQLGWITAGAIVIFAGLRYLPTGTNLSHMDFRVDPRSTNAIEFCDPLNPQFIPVVAVKSPVTLTLAHPPATLGARVRCTATLRTTSGKPIAPEDLVIAHTKKLHLMIVDPSLQDYHHVHPEPGARPGEWTFEFRPGEVGVYRVFADFTPAATGRGLYASADIPVQAAAADLLVPKTTEQEGYRFTLTPAQSPLRAGQPIDLVFRVQRADGGAVPLEPVMGAFAHLVAFDRARSGFAHLHPAQADLTQRPDALHPQLDFKLTIPRAGRYVIWAQVNLAGSERFAPFWFDVE
jgi:hypothetical protein